MTTEKFDQYWEAFKQLCPAAIAMSHYDLAEQSNLGTADDWKEFLMETEVKDYIATEIDIIKDTELKKMIQGINKSRSVGQAQLMSALSKLNETKTTKDGPVFIYNYVPASTEQEQAPNFTALPEDPFLVKG